jgi:hypothetical protein
MKKTLLIVALLVLVVGGLGVGVAFAQGGQPPAGQGGGYGWMHDYVEQALARKLGLTEEQVEEQLAAGKSMYQIALDNGITQQDLPAFMTEVHQEAVASAVKAGAITQAQADWMLQRMQNMYRNGSGAGNCPMRNGQGAPFGRGRGYGSGMTPALAPGASVGGHGPGQAFRQGTQNP